MAGLNRTAPLKFDHPGLATTATRSGERLVIQNDIGTTDAHVIVMHVEGLTAQVTYTDVHPERLRFLQAMLARFPVSWGAAQTRMVAGLAEGRRSTWRSAGCEAADEAGLLAYLEFLGSRLVFLIDWNRARKALRSFLRGAGPGRGCCNGRRTQEVGHRGFLELGGARLINQAIEAASGGAMHFGDRLCDVLGDAAAAELVRFVLRTASEGLRAHQSQGLIRDRVRAELQTHFSNEGRRLLRRGRRACRAGVRDRHAWCATASPRRRPARAGWRAGRAGPRASSTMPTMVVIEVREAVRRRRDHEVVLRLVEAADDAADQLEEAAFLLELLAESGARGRPLDRLAALADLLVEGAQEWIKALGHAGAVAARGAPRARGRRRLPGGGGPGAGAGARGRRCRARAALRGGAARPGFPPVASLFRGRPGAGGGRRRAEARPA